jgi:7-carboxy-7-deazaguanine synthase
VTELAVSEVFGPTLQGEGPTAGRRAGFLRLARCNLDCSWCDTPYTWDWKRFDPATEVHRRSVDDVVAQLDAMSVDRVVVTGGEPLLQQRALEPLLDALGTRGWAVEIETNGTIEPSATTTGVVTQFNVSPKLANSGVPWERRIDAAVLRALVDTGKAIFKFVVTGPADLDEVAGLVEQHRLAPVWLMPEGTTAAAIVEGARAIAPQAIERGWNLGTRLHVVLWGDERGR